MRGSPRKTRRRRKSSKATEPLEWYNELLICIVQRIAVFGEKLKKSFCLTTILIIMALCIISGCNMPSPEQLPGEPTPDLNLILTQIAVEQQASAVPT